jgi:hypothetical protein
MGNEYCLITKKLDMDSPYAHMTASALRTIIIQEMRKFAWALELGSSLSDLEEIRTHIRSLVDTLSVKEKEEMEIVEIFPQQSSNIHPHL